PDNFPIDAVRLTKFMESKLHNGDDNWTKGDNKGGLHRKARMFKEGVAALQEYFGNQYEAKLAKEAKEKGLEGEAAKAYVK
ncbi:hypothetical protein M3M33_16435, partial [Loigolactobacillus coryniformis]|uniref:hypothetical protein n=1 Tax=Loigolactobacillus coryniformis TaxID=1610 RepID=UPI00201B1A28